MDARITIESRPRSGLVSVLEERLPHIVQGLISAWHDVDATDRFLNTILLDDRNDRNGLPEEAFSELMFLSDLNWERQHFIDDSVHVSADGFSFGNP